MAGSNERQALEDHVLLATKLYVPRARPTLLSRPRLLARLEAGLHGPVTVITAPTGSGKTALLTDWLGQHARSPGGHTTPDRWPSIAWLSLDARDDDFLLFLRYLVGACQLLVPSAGATVLALLQSGLDPTPPLPVVIAPLINDLALAPTQSILVLDDYHVISDVRIHEAVTFMLDHLPPRLHTVIVTQSDPPLPLARWRAHGMLTELRAVDLRFTVEEAGAFLTQVMQLPLSAADVRALEERTEGWIAGLQFAALAMRDRADLQRFLHAFTGSHRFVVDYLVDEVLLRQPPHRQTFLLQTAILDRMCSPLCDAVVLGIEGHADKETSYSQVVLEELEQANLFVVPLDDTRQWYRYHHLFADVLRHRLQSGASPGEIRSLHARAAAWHEQHGLIVDAVQHSLQAADHERCARIIEQVGRQFTARGEVGLLQRWLAQLPSELIRSRLQLSLVAAWALSQTADTDAMAARLDDAERLLSNDASGAEITTMHDQLEGELWALRGYVALRQQQIPTAITLLQQAQARVPAANGLLRGMNVHHLGHAYLVNRDFEAASRAYAEAETILRTSEDTRRFALYPLTMLGMIEEARGRLRRAGETYRRALELAFVGDRPLPLAGYAYMCLGRLHYEWDELPAAASHLQAAIQLGQQGALDQIVAEGSIALAMVWHAQGDLGEIDGVVQQAVEAARRWSDGRLRMRVAASAARIGLQQGRMAEARQWAEAAQIDIQQVQDVKLEHLTLARLLQAEGRVDEARELLERLAVQAEGSDQLGAAIEALVLLAVVHQSAGTETQALAVLERALHLAESEGYIRTFLDTGPALPLLLEEGLRRNAWGREQGDAHGPVTIYARALLERCSPSSAAAARSADRSAGLPPGVEPLTARELEVLRLIAAGKSNGEIAEALVVAVSTVKAHINNIFGKLGVTSRTQALVRAREFQLL